jgi:hypothetical protein
LACALVADNFDSETSTNHIQHDKTKRDVEANIFADLYNTFFTTDCRRVGQHHGRDQGRVCRFSCPSSFDFDFSWSSVNRSLGVNDDNDNDNESHTVDRIEVHRG